MKLEFKMPKMGETIINWLINEGDSFDEGDIILEVATDKVDNEVPAPASGTLIKTMFQAKDVVPVGEVLAILEVSKEVKTKTDKVVSSSAVENKGEKKKSKSIVTSSAVEMPQSKSFSVNNTNTFFSPLIIKIAKEHHISFEELARIPATGNEGRLRKSDVFSYIEDGRPFKFAQAVTQDPTAYRIPQLNFDKGKGKVIEMDRMRQMIADHMVAK